MRGLVFILFVVLASSCAPSRVSEVDASLLDATMIDSVSIDATPVTGTVYAHSGSRLYKLDVETLTTSIVGDWGAGVGSMLDIAVNRFGAIVGATSTHLYSIDPQTAEATELSQYRFSGDDIQQLNGMTFILDADNAERLVGVNTFGEVWEIDMETGARNLLGDYGISAQGNAIGSSGDIVAVQGLGIYATVRNGPSNDWLAVIDPQTFTATLVAELDYTALWGIGFWGDRLYGFGSTGKLLQIDPANGDTTLIEDFQNSWYGAGVVTNAIVID